MRLDRKYLRRLARSLGLLEPGRRLRSEVRQRLLPSARQAVRDSRRRHQALRRRLAVFEGDYRSLFAGSGEPSVRAGRRALFVSTPPPWVEVELCLMKGLEAAGWAASPLVMHKSDVLAGYYEVAGRHDACRWSRFFDPESYREAAESLLEGRWSLESVLAIDFAGRRVGLHALASAMRVTRVGHVDFDSRSFRRAFVGFLASSLAADAAAQAVLEEVRPDAVVMADTVYTPKGNLFDACLARGVPVIRWYPGPRNNCLMLKRYSSTNRDEDVFSLSESSWSFVRGMAWNAAQEEELDREFQQAYATGDWFAEAGTQFNTRLAGVDAVRRRLGLDASKKAAFLFPHISWDASFNRGQDLFASYEDWLIETVRAACANDRVQWVIKIHPAHVGKGMVEAWHREPAETAAIRRRIGGLPPHVTVIPATTDISTWSVLAVADYCLTVRGTVGLEAARLGTPVLTGGTGRYDRKGFTIDSSSREEYLGRVASIERIPRLSPAQVELANRFAYGLFKLRPLPLSSVEIACDRSYGAENFFNRVCIKIADASGWAEAANLRAFAEWMTSSSAEDFLNTTRRSRPRPGDGTSYHADALGAHEHAGRPLT